MANPTRCMTCGRFLGVTDMAKASIVDTTTIHDLEPREPLFECERCISSASGFHQGSEPVHFPKGERGMVV